MAHAHLLHPGIVLRDYYLAESDITQAQLAAATGLSASRVNELCNGKRDITADIALRLGQFFGVDPRLFLNMQNNHDIEKAAAAQRAAKLKIRPFTPKRATAQMA
jgi:addiction module HigA family antidote